MSITGVSGPGVMKADNTQAGAEGHQVELDEPRDQGASAGELFDRLEEKVLALAEEMARLKQDNQRLSEELAQARTRVEGLEQQLAEARAERQQVRERLQRLVARLEAL